MLIHIRFYLPICTYSSNSKKKIVDFRGVCFSGEAESELNFTELVNGLNEKYKVKITYDLQGAKLRIDGDCWYVTGKFRLIIPKRAAKKLIEENHPATKSNVREPYHIYLNNNVQLNFDNPDPEDFGANDSPSHSSDYKKSRYKNNKNKNNLLKKCLLRNLNVK